MSDSPSSKPVRPFSLRPEDLLSGSEKEKFQAERAEARERAAKEAKAAPPPPLFGESDEPPASVGRVATHSLRASKEEAPAVQADHTILMAVPPPAQENSGD